MQTHDDMIGRPVLYHYAKPSLYDVSPGPPDGEAGTLTTMLQPLPLIETESCLKGQSNALPSSNQALTHAE